MYTFAVISAVASSLGPLFITFQTNISSYVSNYIHVCVHKKVHTHTWEDHLDQTEIYIYLNHRCTNTYVTHLF